MRRITEGQGTCPPGAIKRLALAGIDMARARGLTVERLKASHVRESCSQYLHLRDQAGRPWIIRVSDHHRPNRARFCETPQLSLVSLDGTSGRDSLGFFLDEIASGRAEWFDPTESYRPLRPRRRR